MKLYSDTFKDVKGFNKAYKELRSQLIKTMDYPSNVRFSAGCFTLETYYDDGKPATIEEMVKGTCWQPYTSNKNDMRFRLSHNPNNDLFRLATIDTNKLVKL